MFKLPESKESLPKTEHIETVLRQISAQSVLTKDSFSNGEIQFRFSSTAVDKYFIPSKSFFQLQVEITRADGTPLLKSDGIALAQNTAANLFSSCQVKLGGQVITNVNAHLAQIDTLRQRMDKSNDWLKSVGDNTNMWGDWQARRDRVCIDSADNYREDGGEIDILKLTDGSIKMPANPEITTAQWNHRWQWRWRYIPKSVNEYAESELKQLTRNRGRYCLELFFPMTGGTVPGVAGGNAITADVNFPDFKKVIKKYDQLCTPSGKFIVEHVLSAMPDITSGQFGLSKKLPLTAAGAGPQDATRLRDDTRFGIGGYDLDTSPVYPASEKENGANVFIFFVDDDKVGIDLGNRPVDPKNYKLEIKKLNGAVAVEGDVLRAALTNSYAVYGNADIKGTVDQGDTGVTARAFNFEQSRRGWNLFRPGSIRWQPMVADTGVGQVELIWQPPSSLFHSHKQALPQAAEMEITLHPAVDYKRAAVETRGVKSLVPTASYENKTQGDYKFAVKKMLFYMCETRNHVFNQDKFVLDLEEVTAQQSVIDSANFQEVSFTVNRATKALTAAFVDKRQDTDTRTSRAIFKAYDDTDTLSSGALRPLHENLQSIVFDYAGQQYPVNQIKFEYDPLGDPYAEKVVTPKNWFTQRYLESLLFQGKMDDAAAVETFREWFDRGYYIHWQCDKPSRNENTRAIIKTEFKENTNVKQMYLLLFEHHRNVVEITLNAAKRIDTIQRYSVL